MSVESSCYMGECVQDEPDAQEVGGVWSVGSVHAHRVAPRSFDRVDGVAGSSLAGRAGAGTSGELEGVRMKASRGASLEPKVLKVSS